MVHTRRDGGCAHRRTRNSELGVRDSEFLSVVQSMADGLREACGALWISIPTQTGFSRYTVIVRQLLQTVWTPTLCIPDTSDRPGYFLISLSSSDKDFAFPFPFLSRIGNSEEDCLFVGDGDCRKFLEYLVGNGGDVLAEIGRAHV